MASPAARPRAKKLSEEEFAAEQAQIEAENRRANALVPLEDQVAGNSVENLTENNPETETDAANRGNSTTKAQKKGKPKDEPEARTFKIAHPAGPIAKLLISDHYPELSQLDIRFIFTSKAGALRLKRPDIREHSSVLARHGLYTAELKAQRKMLASAVLQPTLDVQEGGA